MSCGATIVTFLLFAGIVPGRRNCLHVIDEIHEIRSPSSVSGFMLSFTIRLPAGNFLQELNSFSPGRSELTTVVPGAAAGAGTAPGGCPASGPPSAPPRRPSLRAVFK